MTLAQTSHRLQAQAQEPVAVSQAVGGKKVRTSARGLLPLWESPLCHSQMKINFLNAKKFGLRSSEMLAGAHSEEKKI